MVKAAALLSVLVLASWGQTPTPQEVQQAQQLIQSGGQITPEMIDAAKAQHPELEGMTSDQIQQKVDEAQQKKGNKATSPKAADQKSTDANQKAADQKAADQKSGDQKSSDQKSDDQKSSDQKSSEADAKDGETSLVSREGDGSSREYNLGNAPRFPGMKRFGEDFFNNTDVGEGLGANAPALPQYILSPGDEIDLYIWGRETHAQTVTIDDDGMFKFAPLQPFRVSGMRFADAQNLIAKEIQKIQGLTVSVRLGKLKSIRIMVLGEALRPGSYVLPAGITVTAALFRSGGISRIGSMRNIEVRRNGRIITKLDIYDMLLKGSVAGDIQLLPGDALFVPLAKMQIAVTGLVKRPAIYEVSPGTKALDAVELAGGLSSEAFKGRVRLDRVQNNKRNVVLDVDMEKIDLKSNVSLEDGDILFVDKVLSRVDDVVYLEGNVNRPGRYQYKKGMTVRDLVPDLKALKPETYFEYAHIKRPAPDDDRPTLLNFSLSDVFTKHLKVPLEPRDVVVIYSRYDVVARPSVKISGTVRQPGEFPFREGMNISDLVILAGGLQDAYLPETHLTRVIYDKDKDSTYSQLIRVNLKNILENPQSEENLELRPFDVLKVFPRSNFEPHQTVSISGAVKSGGSFDFLAQTKISDLIVMAGGLQDAYLPEAHLRRLTTKPGNDSTFTELIKVNLKHVVENPEGPENLDIQAFDALTVLPRSNFVSLSRVSIYGAVKAPGDFPLEDKMGIPELVRMAGGLTKSSYKLGIEIIRKYVVKDSVSVRKIVSLNLRDLLEGKATFDLQDEDGIYIREVVHSRERFVVNLDGEFNFPGVYEFVEGERLSSVIRRAGGFTDQAYLRGAIFLRTSVRDRQLRHADEIGRRLESQLQGMLLSTTNEKDRQGILQAMDQRRALVAEISTAPYLGRVVVKLDKKLKFKGTSWDLTLENGDVLTVGHNVSTVSVLGEVYSPTTVIFTSSTNTVGECLSKAGGVTEYGQYKGTFYMAPDGSVSTPRTTPWFLSFRGKGVEPGGTIIVPPLPPAKNYLDAVVKVTQALYQIAITVGVAKTLF